VTQDSESFTSSAPSASSPSPAAGRDGAAPFAATDYPTLYAAADAFAEQYQDRQQWVVRFNLLLIVAGTVALIVSDLHPVAKQLFPTITAVFLAVGFVTQIVVRRRPVDRKWFNGRALAEAVKGATWRYVEAAAPYGGAAADAAARFADDLRLLHERYDTGTSLLGTSPEGTVRITPKMEAMRAAPLAERKAVYLRERTDDQVLWYTRRAAYHRARATRLFWVAQTAQGIAIAVAFGRAVFGYPYGAIALFTTFTAVATAWSGSGRHGELGGAYAATAEALTTTRARIVAAETDAALDEAVTGAEDAIAREQSAWVVKRT